MVRRKSKQREEIYNLIESTKSHPTAQWIYDTLRKEMPKLSLGNVYRNLNILLEQKKIISREFGDDIDHYDADTNTHYHFICEKCGRVSDIDMPVKDKITEEAKKYSNHKITGHSIRFVGVCDICNNLDKNRLKIKNK
jgi:Fur family transcriptional regulator, peroxide stress response regulator